MTGMLKTVTVIRVFIQKNIKMYCSINEKFKFIK